jgi:hypothetical protein
MHSSHITSTAAGQQQADLLAAADRSRRAAGTQRTRSARPRRIVRVLRRRAVVA